MTASRGRAARPSSPESEPGRSQAASSRRAHLEDAYRDADRRLTRLVNASAGAGAGRAVWFVSLALPIEAASPAEAVREFWTYVDKLGPRELPAYVWPLGDELAMQAFVLGAVTNLDPEEDEH